MLRFKPPRPIGTAMLVLVPLALVVGAGWVLVHAVMEALATARASGEPPDLYPVIFSVAFGLFALPFLVLGLNEASDALRGRRLWKGTRVSGGAVALPGGAAFLVAMIVSTFGSFGALALSEQFRYPWNAVVFAGFVPLIPISFLVTQRAIRHHEGSSEAALADPGHEPSPEEKVADDLQPLTRRMTVIGIVATLFLGASSIVAAKIVLDIVAARATKAWTETRGEILQSHVETDHGGDEPSHRPFVQYRYTADGRSYESERLAFGTMGSNRRDEAAAAIEPFPAGATIPVWYDPGEPSEAVLRRNVPGSSWMILLFMQPFLLLGLGMAGYTIRQPAGRRRLVRFLAHPPHFPWTIPGWGIVRDGPHGRTIRRKIRLGDVVIPLAIGFTAACFVTICVLILTAGVRALDQRGFLFALAGAGGVGLVPIAWHLRQCRSTVTFDMRDQEVTVRSPIREERCSFGEIRSWRVRDVRYPNGLSVNGSRQWYLLLEVLLRDGRTMPVHRFPHPPGDFAEETQRVARRAQEVFAGWTEKAARKTLARTAPEGDPVSGRNPVAMLAATVRLLQHVVGRASHGDLR